MAEPPAKRPKVDDPLAPGQWRTTMTLVHNPGGRQTRYRLGQQTPESLAYEKWMVTILLPCAKMATPLSVMRNVPFKPNTDKNVIRVEAETWLREMWVTALCEAKLPVTATVHVVSVEPEPEEVDAKGTIVSAAAMQPYAVSTALATPDQALGGADRDAFKDLTYRTFRRISCGVDFVRVRSHNIHDYFVSIAKTMAVPLSKELFPAARYLYRRFGTHTNGTVGTHTGVYFDHHINTIALPAFGSHRHPGWTESAARRIMEEYLADLLPTGQLDPKRPLVEQTMSWKQDKSDLDLKRAFHIFSIMRSEEYDGSLLRFMLRQTAKEFDSDRKKVVRAAARNELLGPTSVEAWHTKSLIAFRCPACQLPCWTYRDTSAMRVEKVGRRPYLVFKYPTFCGETECTAVGPVADWVIDDLAKYPQQIMVLSRSDDRVLGTSMTVTALESVYRSYISPHEFGKWSYKKYDLMETLCGAAVGTTSDIEPREQKMGIGELDDIMAEAVQDAVGSVRRIFSASNPVIANQIEDQRQTENMRLVINHEIGTGYKQSKLSAAQFSFDMFAADKWLETMESIELGPDTQPLRFNKPLPSALNYRTFDIEVILRVQSKYRTGDIRIEFVNIPATDPDPASTFAFLKGGVQALVRTAWEHVLAPTDKALILENVTVGSARIHPPAKDDKALLAAEYVVNDGKQVRRLRRLRQAIASSLGKDVREMWLNNFVPPPAQPLLVRGSEAKSGGSTPTEMKLDDTASALAQNTESAFSQLMSSVVSFITGVAEENTSQTIDPTEETKTESKDKKKKRRKKNGDGGWEADDGAFSAEDKAARWSDPHDDISKTNKVPVDIDPVAGLRVAAELSRILRMYMYAGVATGKPHNAIQLFRLLLQNILRYRTVHGTEPYALVTAHLVNVASETFDEDVGLKTLTHETHKESFAGWLRDDIDRATRGLMLTDNVFLVKDEAKLTRESRRFVGRLLVEVQQENPEMDLTNPPPGLELVNDVYIVDKAAKDALTDHAVQYINMRRSDVIRSVREVEAKATADFNAEFQRIVRSPPAGLRSGQCSGTWFWLDSHIREHAAKSAYLSPFYMLLSSISHFKYSLDLRLSDIVVILDGVTCICQMMITRRADRIRNAVSHVDGGKIGPTAGTSQVQEDAPVETAEPLAKRRKVDNALLGAIMAQDTDASVPRSMAQDEALRELIDDVKRASGQEPAPKKKKKRVTKEEKDQQAREDLRDYGLVANVLGVDERDWHGRDMELQGLIRYGFDLWLRAVNTHNELSRDPSFACLYPLLWDIQTDPSSVIGTPASDADLAGRLSHVYTDMDDRNPQYPTRVFRVVSLMEAYCQAQDDRCYDRCMYDTTKLVSLVRTVAATLPTESKTPRRDLSDLRVTATQIVRLLDLGALQWSYTDTKDARVSVFRRDVVVNTCKAIGLPDAKVEKHLAELTPIDAAMWVDRAILFCKDVHAALRRTRAVSRYAQATYKGFVAVADNLALDERLRPSPIEAKMWLFNQFLSMDPVGEPRKAGFTHQRFAVSVERQVKDDLGCLPLDLINRPRMPIPFTDIYKKRVSEAKSSETNEEETEAVAPDAPSTYKDATDTEAKAMDRQLMVDGLTTLSVVMAIYDDANVDKLLEDMGAFTQGPEYMLVDEGKQMLPKEDVFVESAMIALQRRSTGNMFCDTLDYDPPSDHIDFEYSVKDVRVVTGEDGSVMVITPTIAMEHVVASTMLPIEFHSSADPEATSDGTRKVFEIVYDAMRHQIGTKFDDDADVSKLVKLSRRVYDSNLDTSETSAINKHLAERKAELVRKKDKLRTGYPTKWKTLHAAARNAAMKFKKEKDIANKLGNISLMKELYTLVNPKEEDLDVTTRSMALLEREVERFKAKIKAMDLTEIDSLVLYWGLERLYYRLGIFRQSGDRLNVWPGDLLMQSAASRDLAEPVPVNMIYILEMLLNTPMPRTLQPGARPSLLSTLSADPSKIIPPSVVDAVSTHNEALRLLSTFHSKKLSEVIQKLKKAAHAARPQDKETLDWLQYVNGGDGRVMVNIDELPSIVHYERQRLKKKRAAEVQVTLPPTHPARVEHVTAKELRWAMAPANDEKSRERRKRTRLKIRNNFKFQYGLPNAELFPEFERMPDTGRMGLRHPEVEEREDKLREEEVKTELVRITSEIKKTLKADASDEDREAAELKAISEANRIVRDRWEPKDVLPLAGLACLFKVYKKVSAENPAGAGAGAGAPKKVFEEVKLASLDRDLCNWLRKGAEELLLLAKRKLVLLVDDLMYCAQQCYMTMFPDIDYFEFLSNDFPGTKSIDHAVATAEIIRAYAAAVAFADGLVGSGLDDRKAIQMVAQGDLERAVGTAKSVTTKYVHPPTLKFLWYTHVVDGQFYNKTSFDKDHMSAMHMATRDFAIDQVAALIRQWSVIIGIAITRIHELEVSGTVASGHSDKYQNIHKQLVAMAPVPAYVLKDGAPAGDPIAEVLSSCRKERETKYVDVVKMDAVSTIDSIVEILGAEGRNDFRNGVFDRTPLGKFSSNALDHNWRELLKLGVLMSHLSQYKPLDLDYRQRPQVNENLFSLMEAWGKHTKRQNILITFVPDSVKTVALDEIAERVVLAAAISKKRKRFKAGAGPAGIRPKEDTGVIDAYLGYEMAFRVRRGVDLGARESFGRLVFAAKEYMVAKAEKASAEEKETITRRLDRMKHFMNYVTNLEMIPAEVMEPNEAIDTAEGVINALRVAYRRYFMVEGKYQKNYVLWKKESELAWKRREEAAALMRAGFSGDRSVDVDEEFKVVLWMHMHRMTYKEPKRYVMSGVNPLRRQFLEILSDQMTKERTAYLEYIREQCAGKKGSALHRAFNHTYHGIALRIMGVVAPTKPKSKTGPVPTQPSATSRRLLAEAKSKPRSPLESAKKPKPSTGAHYTAEQPLDDVARALQILEDRLAHFWATQKDHDRVADSARHVAHAVHDSGKTTHEDAQALVAYVESVLKADSPGLARMRAAKEPSPAEFVRKEMKALGLAE